MAVAVDPFVQLGLDIGHVPSPEGDGIRLVASHFAVHSPSRFPLMWETIFRPAASVVIVP